MNNFIKSLLVPVFKKMTLGIIADNINLKKRKGGERLKVEERNKKRENQKIVKIHIIIVLYACT